MPYLNRSAVARISLFILSAALAPAADRVVILKADGLPPRLVDRYVAEGHLPHIREVFYQNGTRLNNFYVRGLSLSAPSWSLLDTGHPLVIRGNVEYDRYTLRAYDYLNFFPFYLGYALSRHVDMAGVELLDEYGVPLLIDHFPYDQRYQGFQLLQRGVRWTTLEAALKRPFTGRPVKQVFDEWQIGVSMSSSLNQQTERELLAAIADPKIRYADYFTGEYDHVAHLTEDSVSQRRAIEDLDALVGRVSAAIQVSPRKNSTALILLSDHGMNTEEGTYSQGYNLVDWFAGSQGGSHNVITDRHPLTEYKLRGLDPFVSEVVTTTSDSTSFLAPAGSQYPSVLLDLDGNERVSVGLRSNTFQILHVLLSELNKKKLSAELRRATVAAFQQELDKVATAWRQDLAELSEELRDMQIRITDAEKRAPSKSRKYTPEERALGIDKDSRRVLHNIETWKSSVRGYQEYVADLTRLLNVSKEELDSSRFKIDELIPPHSFGPPNSIDEFRHYVVGLGPQGLVLKADGSLDTDRSFRRIDYIASLLSLNVRNNVQRTVGPSPVDWIAAEDQGKITVWGRTGEATIVREGERLCYRSATDLLAQGGDRCDTEQGWLVSAGASKYSNVVPGLVEQLVPALAPAERDATSIHSRFLRRQSRLRRTDFLVLASDHWNFNVRGFNPGGNHGSFFSASTRSVLMFAGDGIPSGVAIDTPYDSLNFVPTVLHLLGDTCGADAPSCNPIHFK